MSYMTLALQGASTALGVIGALRQGESDAYATSVAAQSKAMGLEAQAEADSFNAKVSRQMAEAELQRAAGEAGDYRRTQGARAASRRALTGASGLALEGSPLLADESIFQEIDFGASRIGYAGDVAAARLRTQGDLLDLSATRNLESANFARTAGEASARNIKSSSYLKAFGAGVTGLTGITSTLSTGGGGWATPAQSKVGKPLSLNPADYRGWP